MTQRHGARSEGDVIDDASVLNAQIFDGNQQLVDVTVLQRIRNDISNVPDSKTDARSSGLKTKTKTKTKEQN